MLKDKVRYGVTENVVEGAEITAPDKQHQAATLNYKQLNELIYEATTMEDPSFLYLVVMSMTQGLRRGELYITLLLHGIERDDKSIIAPASFFQVYESAGHSLPPAMQNVGGLLVRFDRLKRK